MTAMTNRQERRALTKEVVELRNTIGTLTGDEAHLRARATHINAIEKLKTEVSDLTIAKGKLVEEHARSTREVEHMIGLQRSRQKLETEQAATTATLEVREENLAAERKQFEKNMEFMTERFDKEVEYLKEIADKILARLPDVNVALGNQDPPEVKSSKKDK